MQLGKNIGSLEYNSRCACVGDKGISRGRRAAGGIEVMILRKMWEVSHKLRHHLSPSPEDGCLQCHIYHIPITCSLCTFPLVNPSKVVNKRDTGRITKSKKSVMT